MITQFQNKKECTIQLCSRCMHNEINGWINENVQKLNQSVAQEMLQELRMIKLKQGTCIVCKNSLIVEDIASRILEIMEDNKVSSDLTREFAKDFCVG